MSKGYSIGFSKRTLKKGGAAQTCQMRINVTEVRI